MGGIISAPLTCLASAGGSCAGMFAASCLTKICCAQCSGNKTCSKIGNMIILFICTVLALCMRYFGKPFLINLKGFEYQVEYPVGDAAVYRISFCLSCMYLLMALIQMCKCRTSYLLHRGFWGIKALLLSGFIVGTCFMDNNIFFVYAEIVRYIAPLFLLFQIVLLIEFAYSWNASWLAKDEEEVDSNSWKIAIMLVCLLMYAGSITGIVLMYQYFTGGDGCGLNTFFITLTSIICFVSTVVAASPIAEHGTLLTSAVVTAYCVFLCYSSIASNPHPQCNPTLHLNTDGSEEDDASSQLRIWIGLLIAAASLSWSAYSASNMTEGDGAYSEMNVSSTKADPESGEAEEQETVVEPEDGLSAFYFVMVVCACYMAMLLTDWGSTPDDNDVSKTNLVGQASMWVKILSQWATMALYLWTLVAPALFPDRDFGMD